MPPFPLDVAGPELVLFLGLGAGLAVLLFVVVAVVEGLILRLLRWGGVWRSLLASLIMNLVSSGAGVVLFPVSSALGTLAWLLVAFAASVVIEGVVLTLMNRREPRLSWLGSLAANVVSYIPVGIIYWVVTG